MIKTKEVFLSTLREELEKANIENIDSIIETYEKYFKMAEEAHIKEKDAIAKFGSIEEIVCKYSMNKKEETVEATVVEEKIEETQTQFDVKEAINTVKVSVVSEDVKVSLYDGKTVTFNLDDESLKNAYDIIYDENGNITFKRKMFGTLKGLFSSKKSFASSVEVFIPRSVRINKLELSSATGDVTVDYISTKDVSITSISGSIRIGSIYNDSLTLNSTSGSVDIDDLNSNDVRLSVITGNISINKGSVRKIYFDTISGNINVDNEENIGIEQIKFSSVTGSLKLGDKKYKESFTNISNN